MNKDTAREKYKLSDDKRNELQKKYYAGESTTKLIEEFNLLGLQPSQITYLFNNTVTDIKCDYCNVFMEKEPATRTSTEKDIICPNCGHKILNEKWRTCNCDNCKNKAINDIIIKEEKLKKGICTLLNLEHKKSLYASENLSEWEKLILGALVTFTMDEELEYFKPLDNFNRSILANQSKSIEIIKELYANGILILGNRYFTDAFELNENNEVTSYTVTRVFYEPWFDDELLCKKLLNPENFLSPDQILLFWRDFNTAEATKYLLNEFEKIGINSFSPGAKTKEVFAAMAEKLSLSQIFRVIRYVTEKTAKDILTREVYHKQAANATITRMESYFKRALYENYKIYVVKYEDDLSMVTTYFYNKILNMGDSAFYSVPNKELKQFTILKSDGN